MPDVGPEERWVGVDDVAAHLGVGRDSVYRWVEKRGLPARRVGRLLRFKLSEVDAWVEAGGGEGNGPKESRTHARNPPRKKPR
jgi:excisionase family DNA binding protein